MKTVLARDVYDRVVEKPVEFEVGDRVVARIGNFPPFHAVVMGTGFHHGEVVYDLALQTQDSPEFFAYLDQLSPDMIVSMRPERSAL